MTRRLIPVLTDPPANIVFRGRATTNEKMATNYAENMLHSDNTRIAVLKVGATADDGVPLYCAVRYEVRDTCDKLTVRADDHNDRKAKEYEGL